LVVRFIESCRLPTPFGVFDMHGFEEISTGQEHVALSLGDVADGEPVLARTHPNVLPGMPSTACAVIAAISLRKPFAHCH